MKPQTKPLIAGGRTLSKMYRGSKGSSSGGNKKRRAIWFQTDGKSYGEPARTGCHLEGDPKRKIPTK